MIGTEINNNLTLIIYSIYGGSKNTTLPIGFVYAIFAGRLLNVCNIAVLWGGRG